MKKLLVANWKMNPKTLREANKLLSAITIKPTPKEVDLVVCPPAPYLSALRLLRNATLGAQNVHWEKEGAHTGEYSAHMLKNLGVKYVIVGHSERRAELGETDEMINKKITAALKEGLKVILCVGEDLKTRKKGFLAASYAVKNQLVKNLNDVEKVKGAAKNIIVAYEPVWAISTSGSGKKETPKDAAEMINFISNQLNEKMFGAKVRVIYGGSVNAQNIASFIKYPEIEGALVGGASLKTGEFKKMIDLVAKEVDKK